MDLPIPMWWAEFDFKLRQQKKLQQSSGKGSLAGDFDWAEARRRHREKMNGKRTGN